MELRHPQKAAIRRLTPRLGFFEDPDNPPWPRQAQAACEHLMAMCPMVSTVYRGRNYLQCFALFSEDVRLDRILATSQPVPTGRSAQPIYDDLRQTYRAYHPSGLLPDLSARSAVEFPHVLASGPPAPGHFAVDPFDTSTLHTISTEYLPGLRRYRRLVRVDQPASSEISRPVPIGFIHCERDGAPGGLHQYPEIHGAFFLCQVTQSTWHDGSAATPDYQQQSPRDNILAQSHTAEGRRLTTYHVKSTSQGLVHKSLLTPDDRNRESGSDPSPLSTMCLSSDCKRKAAARTGGTPHEDGTPYWHDTESEGGSDFASSMHTKVLDRAGSYADILPSPQYEREPENGTGSINNATRQLTLPNWATLISIGINPNSPILRTALHAAKQTQQSNARNAPSVNYTQPSQVHHVQLGPATRTAPALLSVLCVSLSLKTPALAPAPLNHSQDGLSRAPMMTRTLAAKGITLSGLAPPSQVAALRQKLPTVDNGW
ncbi:hypothetical protein CORC01_05052 [Colletotrichum orchidophilum]|uniref:Uncharacterized protein n=1 Tax=Colletotrichum orchidophilum TaxID=1209926 RepID=A0A1G4BE46_9PEZI|nr:uncharacterized protein CORC01_05052 [Colletotrichum orchidophilum]OHE99694.1 hypothetical protein CORC01_05052 [Colletotrichum orchidophilum]